MTSSPQNQSGTTDAIPVTVVCISDTHSTTPTMPPGDILLHAGDLTIKGTFAELQSHLDWLNTLPHQHKIVIGGNHDLLLDDEFVSSFPERIFPKAGEERIDLEWGSVTYLNNNKTTLTVRGREVAVFGSPMTPRSGNWAFQYPPIRDVWKDAIPARTDIFLTHGPPKGHLDNDMGSKGCEWLNRELWRTRPSLVVFGHIHAGRGREDLSWDHVQRVYDGVQVGEKGFGSVISMAVLLVVQKVWQMLSKRKRAGTTTLINAAVVGGRGNCEHFSPIVVEI